MAFANLDGIQRPSTAATLIPAWGDQVNDNINFLYGDLAFTNASPLNGWVNLGSGFSGMGYCLTGTVVYLRGRIKNGTMGAPAWNMPAKYRPTNGALLFPCVNAAGVGVVQVDTAGNVTPVVGTNTDLSINLSYSVLN